VGGARGKRRKIAKTRTTGWPGGAKQEEGRGSAWQNGISDIMSARIEKARPINRSKRDPVTRRVAGVGNWGGSPNPLFHQYGALGGESRGQAITGKRRNRTVVAGKKLQIGIRLKKQQKWGLPLVS